MNQLVMGVIGSGSTQKALEIGKKDLPSKKNDFKDTMDEALTKQKPIDQGKQNIDRNDVKESTEQNIDKFKLDSVKEKYLEDLHIKEENNDTEEAILTILQQLMAVLNVSQEELTETLETMGLSVDDLLSQENFSQLLDELTKADELLLSLDSEQVKEINKIWSQLEQLQVATSYKDINQESLLDQQNVANDTALPDDMALEEVEGQIKVEEFKNTSVLEVGPVPNEVQGVKRVESHEKNANDQQSKGMIVENNISQEILGLKIPIQSFEVTSQVRLWENNTEQPISNMLSKGVIDQVIEKIEINQLLRSNEITMELTPKELGKLAFKLTEQNGMITAQVRVDSERTKEMIMDNIHVLQESLEKQGLSVGGFQVDVRGNESQKHMEQQQQKASKRIQELINREIEALSNEEMKEEEVQYTQFDYKA